MNKIKMRLLPTTNYLPAMPSAKLMQAGQLPARIAFGKADVDGPTRRKAFTLIELLIVVAIIGVLATIIIMKFTSAKDSSRYARVVSDMTLIGTAVKSYSMEHNNVYPVYPVLPVLPVGSEIPTGIEEYLPGGWPVSPCDSYVYHYSMISPDEIGINYLRKPAPPRFIYYLSIKNYPSAGHGTDINTISPKEITCHE